MKNAGFGGLKRALSLGLALMISVSCFATLGGISASAAIANTWGIVELETDDYLTIEIGGTAEKYLKFVPKCTGDYVIESACISNMMVTLYDESEAIVATDDNGKDEGNFRLSAKLTGGKTYYYGIKPTVSTATTTCFVTFDCVATECEHEDGVYSAGAAATCHSDGYEPGYWCDDCDRWYVGHERIEGGHLDTKEDTDDLCDRCGGTMPGLTGEIGPSERRYKVKYQFYPDGSMDIYGTDYIRQAAFGDILYTYIRSEAKCLKIYEGVKHIEDSAFGEFKKLETVELPDSITKICREVFISCEALRSINIPKNVKYIAEYSFSGCKSLQSITLPDSMSGNNNGLGIGVFQNCTSLKTVDLGEGMESVGQDAFNGCTALTTVIGGSNATRIESGAFKGCSSLTNIVIKGKTKNIGANAFENCTSLATVYMSSKVVNIGEAAFNGCSALTDVYYGGLSKQGISIGQKNNSLSNAAWHYDQCVGKTTHSFDNVCDDECNDCGSTREVGEHTYSYECDATCNICGYVRSAGSHRYEKICDTVCKNCKETTRVVLFHYYSGDCDPDCSECGFTRTAAPHTYDNDCDTYCNGCSLYREPKHTYTNSCDEICDVCGMGRAIQHKYTNDCDGACNVCGATRDVCHEYANDCNAACKLCGQKRGLRHNTYGIITQATFTKNGKTELACYNCDYKTAPTQIKRVSTVKLSKTEYTYNGKAQKPTVTVKDSGGKTLKKDLDYTLSYASGRKNVGTYKVTVKLRGKYKGEKVLTFKINPKATKISKVTAAKKSLKVKISKQTTQVTGYEVQYSTAKDFKKSTKTATVKSAKTTSLTIKKLKAKKTYYLRIRTFKTVGGKKYYSAWSKTTSKKTK